MPDTIYERLRAHMKKRRPADFSITMGYLQNYISGQSTEPDWHGLHAEMRSWARDANCQVIIDEDTDIVTFIAKEEGEEGGDDEDPYRPYQLTDFDQLLLSAVPKAQLCEWWVKLNSWVWPEEWRPPTEPWGAGMVAKPDGYLHLETTRGGALMSAIRNITGEEVLLQAWRGAHCRSMFDERTARHLIRRSFVEQVEMINPEAVDGSGSIDLTHLS